MHNEEKDEQSQKFYDGIKHVRSQWLNEVDIKKSFGVILDKLLNLYMHLNNLSVKFSW